jgi:hypothetical protein
LPELAATTPYIFLGFGVDFIKFQALRFMALRVVTSWCTALSEHKNTKMEVFMKNKHAIAMLSFATILISLVSISAFSADPTQELNSEVANHQSKIDKKDMPKGILVKTDAQGNVSIYKSMSDLDAKAMIESKAFEKFAFETVAKPVKPIDELNNDKPRQSWYVWYNPYIYYNYAYANYGYGYGYSYGYYNYGYAYPMYYYGYNYYPYYNYAYGGCNYYWYH